MIKSSLQTMETIHEANHKMAGMPGVLPEAALFSVVKPNQLRPEIVVMSAAIDGLSGRSSSLKMPLTRKASFRVREWVKRSSSSRTTRTSGLSASDSMKAQIKHLGGGRLEEVVEVQGSTSNTTLLAPVPKRAQRSRASSADSRVTQWLDFYTGSPEPLPSAHAPSRHQRPGSNSDLRPAPLRVPSSERRGSPTTPPKALVRKDSSSKPLPLLPAQPIEPKHTEPGRAVDDKAKSDPHHRETEPSASSSSRPKPSSEPGKLEFLPLLRFGTPPPTPDSSAGGAANTHSNRDKGKGKEVESRAAPPEPKLDSETMVAREKTQTRPEMDDSVRHTRQERVWLHINYRGEAPFLQAWGLNITKPADRLEGLAILRELIQADGERKEMEGNTAAIQGSTSMIGVC